MNFWTIINNILGLVPRVIDAVSGISKAARTGPKPKAETWMRGHFWVVESYDRGPAHYTYHCSYCKLPWNDATARIKCTGPKV